MRAQTSLAQRYRSLLKVSEVALTTPTPLGLFEGFCAALKDAVPYDRAGLSLYDPDQDGLRIVGIHGPHAGSIYTVGYMLSRQNTQSGWVFEHKTMLFRRDLEKEIRFLSDKRIMEEGYRSICSVPLVVRESGIGVLSVVASRRNQLTNSHAEMVEQMSKLIALALSSVLPRCSNHTNTKLVCPRCIGAAGGKTTVSKHRDDLSDWGKKGGRGHKISYC
jgi:formate hydrogenlyase transcriptional activator